MNEPSLEDNDNKSEAADDLEHIVKDTARDNLSLYEAESQILTLYDQLADLRLEKALVETQIDLQSGTTIIASCEQPSLRFYH